MNRRLIRIATVALIFAIPSCTPYNPVKPTGEMDYPRAEWDKAGEILMHTPGEELFAGVIHPSAGLFEDYFDEDIAAEEHRGYIQMLEKNGIRVHTVTDILQEVGIDTLRLGRKRIRIGIDFGGKWIV